MIFKKQSPELNEEQKKALNELKEKNQKIVEQVESLSKEYEKLISAFDKDMDKFWDITHQMEKANSHYPFGHYAHYYHRNLEEPSSESFILNFGQKNPNYCPLSEEGKKMIEKQLPDYDKYESIVSEKMKVIQDLVKTVISSNIIVIRIVGISEKYKELEELNKNWWCPSEIAENKYGLKGSFPTYDPHLNVQIPYHRQLMIKFDTLYNTANILRFKLDEIKKILESINSFLPFAELLPSDKMPQTLVNVEASANNESVKIGKDVKFKGDAAIGKDANVKKE